MHFSKSWMVSNIDIIKSSSECKFSFQLSFHLSLAVNLFLCPSPSPLFLLTYVHICIGVLWTVYLAKRGPHCHPKNSFRFNKHGRIQCWIKCICVHQHGEHHMSGLFLLIRTHFSIIHRIFEPNLVFNIEHTKNWRCSSHFYGQKQSEIKVAWTGRINLQRVFFVQKVGQPYFSVSQNMISLFLIMNVSISISYTALTLTNLKNDNEKIEIWDRRKHRQ